MAKCPEDCQQPIDPALASIVTDDTDDVLATNINDYAFDRWLPDWMRPDTSAEQTQKSSNDFSTNPSSECAQTAANVEENQQPLECDEADVEHGSPTLRQHLDMVCKAWQEKTISVQGGIQPEGKCPSPMAQYHHFNFDLASVPCIDQSCNDVPACEDPECVQTTVCRDPTCDPHEITPGSEDCYNTPPCSDDTCPPDLTYCCHLPYCTPGDYEYHRTHCPHHTTDFPPQSTISQQHLPQAEPPSFRHNFEECHSAGPLGLHTASDFGAYPVVQERHTCRMQWSQMLWNDYMQSYAPCYMTCTHECDTAQELQRHIKEMHHKQITKAPNGGFECLWEGCCDPAKPGQRKSFQARNKVERHWCTHTDCKLWVCQECGKEMITKDAMNKHIRIHTGETPYPCTYEGCKSEFKTSSELHTHVGSVHEKKKLHTCDFPECGKSFADSSNLSKHKKSHYKHEFVCFHNGRGCNRTFGRWDQLRRHLETQKCMPEMIGPTEEEQANDDQRTWQERVKVYKEYLHKRWLSIPEAERLTPEAASRPISRHGSRKRKRSDTETTGTSLEAQTSGEAPTTTGSTPCPDENQMEQRARRIRIE